MSAKRISRQDVDRVLKTTKVDPEGFDVWYGDKLVRYTAGNLDKINFDTVTRLTVIFPAWSQGSVYLDGEGKYADKNRKKVRPK